MATLQFSTGHLPWVSASVKDQVWQHMMASAISVHRSINKMSETEPLPVWVEKTLETSISSARIMFEDTNVRASLVKDKVSPLEFWRSHRLSLSICQLKPLAQVLLGLPATAASCERVWSSAGRLNDRRAVLTEKNLEMLIYLRENIKTLGGISEVEIKQIMSAQDSLSSTKNIKN